MTALAPETGPSAWIGSALDWRAEALHTLDPAELREIGEAVRALGERDLPEITPATFPLPTLGPRLQRLGEELRTGRGFLLLRGAKHPGERTEPPRGTPLLGAAAGFLDAVGGGGWSALTATTLLARGLQPRVVIGSVHLAKCVVSIAASAAFLFGIGAGHVVAVLGLIAGGILAAPFGAFFIRHIPARAATVLAGLAVLALGINNAVRILH